MTATIGLKVTFKCWTVESSLEMTWSKQTGNICVDKRSMCKVELRMWPCVYKVELRMWPCVYKVEQDVLLCMELGLVYCKWCRIIMVRLFTLHPIGYRRVLPFIQWTQNRCCRSKLDAEHPLQPGAHVSKGGASDCCCKGAVYASCSYSKYYYYAPSLQITEYWPTSRRNKSQSTGLKKGPPKGSSWKLNLARRLKARVYKHLDSDSISCTVSYRYPVLYIGYIIRLL